jgi:hypothetical protein
MGKPGLKKVVKSVRGKKGSVRRTYWVKSDPKATKQQQPGFLRRNAGKIAGVAALAGAAYLGRHKIGALTGQAKHLALGPGGQHSSSAAGGSRGDRAKQAFHNAKKQYGERATQWRRTVGADAVRHTAEKMGTAGAEHFGSRFGQVAGTAIGGMFGGPAGAAVGGFAGGHFGGFVAGKHAAPHVQRGAEWLANRMRR